MKQVIVPLFISLLVALGGCAQHRTVESHLISKHLVGSPEIRYLLYEPVGRSEGKSYPLVISLHGSGSVGNDLSLVRQTGLPRLIEDGQDFPFFVVAPQLTPNTNNRWPVAYIDEFVVHALTSYPIDPNRIYITGFSTGGAGVWDYTIEYPSKVACAIPISGWGDKESVCKMKEVPTRVFHGAADTIVAPWGSRNMTTGLQGCGGNVELTEFPNGGHDIWREVYAYPNLLSWMTAQHKDAR